MNEDRASRRAWPEPIECDPEVRRPVRVPRRFTLTIAGLTFAMAVLTVALAVFAYWVVDLKSDRDSEAERINQRILDAVCDLLDQLPEGGLLDRPRDKYGCGPGIPLDDLPPEVRQRYEGTVAAPAPPPTPAPTPTTQAPLGAPAVPNPPRPTPNEPPAGNSPKPTPAAPTSPPPDDSVLTPVTDEVCELANICLEVPR